MKVLKKGLSIFINKSHNSRPTLVEQSFFRYFSNTPVSLSKLSDDIFEQKEKIKNIAIKHLSFNTKIPIKKEIAIKQSDTAVLYKKILNPENGLLEKKPFQVNIGSSKEGYITTYHFLEKNTQRELGYITIEDWRTTQNNKIYQALYSSTPLKRDIPSLGLVGDRISIGSLQNNFENEIAGIGEAGDQIALEYCLKEGLKPNITSVAFSNSHAAHFLRGRRFFNVAKFDPEIAECFKNTYGTTNPNKVIENRIKNTPKGQKVDTSDIGNLYMYMPQNIVQKYLQKIKENPFLK